MTQTNEVPGELSDKEIGAICNAHRISWFVPDDSDRYAFTRIDTGQLYSVVRAAIKADQERRSAGTEPQGFDAWWAGATSTNCQVEHAYAAGFKEGVSRSTVGGEAVGALRELVAVKDLKDRTEALHFVGPNGEPPNENWEAEYKAGRAEYLRRQPLAWDAARSALAAPVAAPKVPPSEASDWRIDISAGRSILVYKDCSVIEAEQADYLMGLLKRAALRSGEQEPSK